MQSFGVSRISVRSALQRLAGAGIIESVSGGGTYVKHPQQGSILSGIMPAVALENYDTSQLIDFRRGVETISAELAARFGTDEEIEELRIIYQEMCKFNKIKDVEKYAQHDLAFHMYIAKMSKNPFIIYIMEQLKDIFYVHILRLNQQLRLSQTAASPAHPPAIPSVMCRLSRHLAARSHWWKKGT